MSYITPVIMAFRNKKVKKLSNTESTGSQLKLFNNVIAEWRNDQIWITSAKWKTATTKSRLQTLRANLRVKKGDWFLNGVEWNGDWIQIDAIPEKLKSKTSIYE